MEHHDAVRLTGWLDSTAVATIHRGVSGRVDYESTPPLPPLRAALILVLMPLAMAAVLWRRRRDRARGRGNRRRK